MPLFDMFLAVLVAAIWGANFVSAKFGMGHFAPFFLTALRFIFVAAVLLPFVPRPSKTQLKKIAQVSLVLGVLHFATLFVALHLGLDIASCAVIAQLGVPFSCILSAIFLGDRMGLWRTLGIVIAFIGMILVAGAPDIVQHPLAFFVALGGAFCWGVSNLLIKRIEGVGNFQMLGWMALLAVPQLLVISTFLEGNQWEKIGSTPLSAALALAYTAIGSTIVAYGIWYRLLKRYPLSQVAPFSLLTVPFGIAAGQMFFTETLSWQVLVGGAITIAGVAIIVVRRPKLKAIGEAI